MIDIITVDGKKSSPSIPEITYIVIIVIIIDSLIICFSEMKILNTVDVTTAARWKGSHVMSIPFSILEFKLDDSNIVTSQPIYGKVITSDILVKNRGKVLFFNLKLLSLILFTILDILLYFFKAKQASIKKIVWGTKKTHTIRI